MNVLEICIFFVILLCIISTIVETLVIITVLATTEQFHDFIGIISIIMIFNFFILVGLLDSWFKYSRVYKTQTEENQKFKSILINCTGLSILNIIFYFIYLKCFNSNGSNWEDLDILDIFVMCYQLTIFLLFLGGLWFFPTVPALPPVRSLSRGGVSYPQTQFLVRDPGPFRDST